MCRVHRGTHPSLFPHRPKELIQVERLIRPMEARDLEPSLALWQNVDGIVLRVESDNLDALTRFLARNPGTSFVADKDRALIGNILCGHDGRRGYLYHLA